MSEEKKRTEEEAAEEVRRSAAQRWDFPPRPRTFRNLAANDKKLRLPARVRCTSVAAAGRREAVENASDAARTAQARRLHNRPPTQRREQLHDESVTPIAHER